MLLSTIFMRIKGDDKNWKILTSYESFPPSHASVLFFFSMCHRFSNAVPPPTLPSSPCIFFGPHPPIASRTFLRPKHGILLEVFGNFPEQELSSFHPHMWFSWLQFLLWDTTKVLHGRTPDSFRFISYHSLSCQMHISSEDNLAHTVTKSQLFPCDSHDHLLQWGLASLLDSGLCVSFYQSTTLLGMNHLFSHPSHQALYSWRAETLPCPSP